MSEEQTRITTFYQGFFAARRNGRLPSPASALHRPVFDLHGDDARLMWRMLCTRGKDLQVEFRDVACADGIGRARIGRCPSQPARLR
jgi:hypothetical protein